MFEIKVRCKPCSEQRRDSSEKIGPEENCAERGWIDSESQVKPVHGEALRDEASAKSIECEEPGESEHNITRAPDAELHGCRARFGCGRYARK